MSYDYIRALVDQDFSLDNILLVQPETAEQAFEIAEQGIQSKEFELIIFDSIGGLAPQKEKEDEFTDANVALVPRLLSKFLLRTAFNVRNNNVAFLFLNQVRDNIGSYMKSYTLPGGHALKHFCSIMVSMSKGEQIKFGDEIVGITSKFTVKKNKLAPPFRSFYLSIFFGKGIDTTRDLVEFGITMGILQKGGPYIKYKDEVLGKGTTNTIEYLNAHPEITEAIKHDLLALSNTNLEEMKDIEEEILDV
jgi:recombination protein RecA